MAGARLCMVLLAFSCFAIHIGAVARTDSTANPIRKIVTLMQDMQQEIQGELTKEKELFERFMCICTDYPAKLSESVDENTNKISELKSKIESEEAQQSRLEQDLKGHNEDKSSAEKDLSKATGLREKEQAEFESSLANAKSTLAGVSQVLPVLEKSAAGDASSALLQGPVASRLAALISASSVITPTDKDKVVSFLTNEGQNSEDYAPQSGQIVGILKQMKDEMQHSIKEQESAETVAADGFADLKGAKDQEIAVSGESISSKELRVGKLAVSIADAKDELEDTQSELKDAQEMLHTLTTQCGSRQKEFETRLKLRNDEIAAISEAIKVLNDDDALDVFKKAVPADVAALQTEKSGFLQLHHASSQLQKAIEMVRKTSSSSQDRHLSFLLNSMSAQLRVEERSRKHAAVQAPDMRGVVKMIDGMIDLLNKEQADDEKKKEWCWQEGNKAEKELGAKHDALDNHKAAGEKFADQLAGYGEDLKALEKSIADLDGQVAGATELRKKEHAEYAASVQMAEVAVQLLDKAKNKLMKFYNPAEYKDEESKKDASFLQTIIQHNQNRKAAQMPELPKLGELKQQNEGGVVALMDRIKNELIRDKDEAEFEEKTARQDYVSLMSESAETRAQDAKSLVAKTSSRAQLEKDIIQNNGQTKLSMDELMNANQYVADVHQSCDFLLQNFAPTKDARMQELDGLKNAKGMLAADTR